MIFIGSRFVGRSEIKYVVEVTPHIVLCRFRSEALVNILKPYSLIVIGCRKSRWPTWENKLARKLRRRGYEVLVRDA